MFVLAIYDVADSLVGNNSIKKLSWKCEITPVKNYFVLVDWFYIELTGSFVVSFKIALAAKFIPEDNVWT